MKVAALDLGTNTFLCLIVEGQHGQIIKVHKDLAQVVRLGQGVDKTGEFHPEALLRAKSCLTEFKKEIELHRIDRILAVATSAARDARNGDQLFKIGEDLQIPIKIIPGEDEARITYQGATVGLQDLDKSSLVVDVGGGSTEFILGHGQSIVFGQSLNIGGVRLTEKYVSSQPVTDEDERALRKRIDSEISDVISLLKEKKIDQIIAVAGTPTSLVALEVGGFDEKKVDGFFLSNERLNFWVRQFKTTSIEEKRTKYGLGGRADIIFAGATILASVVDALGLPGMYVSTKGVRYGVALELLREESV